MAAQFLRVSKYQGSHVSILSITQIKEFSSFLRRSPAYSWAQYFHSFNPMSQSISPKFGIILLAAGASTRLGLPKQLLSYRGTSLVRHILSVALESQARPVVVVLGADYRHIAREIVEREDVFIVMNEGWREGIASSIRTGLRALTGIADCDGAILAVCDQ